MRTTQNTQPDRSCISPIIMEQQYQYDPVKYFMKNNKVPIKEEPKFLYPYYGITHMTQMVVKFTAPGEGIVVDTGFSVSFGKGQWCGNWVEEGFTSINYKDDNN